MSDLAATSGVDEAGKALHDATWGDTYPIDVITHKERTFNFYNEADVLSNFFPADFLNLEHTTLIRDEYRLAYEHFSRIQAESPSDKAPNFVLTGQPGIGKTTFILYALLRRLENCRPTVVQLAEEYFVLFDKNGAHRFPTFVGYNVKIPPGSWVLVDSGRKLVEPGAALFGNDTVLVQTTSPAGRRWKAWKKYHSAYLYVMQLWNPEEIEILLVQLQKVGKRRKQYVEDGLSLARKYGPSVRVILQLLDRGQDDEDSYRHTLLSDAYDLVDNDRNINIFNSLESSNLEKASSSTVIFIRPSSLTKRHNYEFFVPTAEVALQLSTAVLAASNQDQQRFFSHMSSHPSTRSAAGWIFENFMHTRLTDKIRHVRALDANYKEHDIPIVTSIITGPVDALKSAPASFYWRPGESKFPGIDAVARDQEDIWAFQCTISRRQRSTIDGLERIAQAIGIRESNWHLVIVGSEMSAAQSAREQQVGILSKTDDWANVKTYAYELTLHDKADRLTALMSSEQPDLGVPMQE